MTSDSANLHRDKKSPALLCLINHFQKLIFVVQIGG